MIARIKRWVLLLWHRLHPPVAVEAPVSLPEAAPAAPPVSPMSPVSPPAVAAQPADLTFPGTSPGMGVPIKYDEPFAKRIPAPKREKKPEDRTHLWVHLADILESMDDYFEWLGKLRKHDPAAYVLFGRIGGAILHSGRYGNEDEIKSDKPPAEWPSFFMSSFPNKDDAEIPKDLVLAKLVYFEKRASPGHCIPWGDIFYRGTYFYTRRGDPVAGPEMFMVGIDSATREIRPLKVNYPHSQELTRRINKDPNGGERTVWAHHTKVIWPPGLKEKAERDKTSVPVMVRRLFIRVLNECLASEQGAQVNVMRGNLTGRFSIPIQRTSYFFKDRGFEVGSRGKRRRIFHVVEAHSRILANGDTIEVKRHYRGARSFEWKNCRVIVTIPGLHHPEISKFVAPAFVLGEDPIRNEEMASVGRLGKAIRNEIVHGDARNLH